jgi:hypothetical protein
MRDTKSADAVRLTFDKGYRVNVDGTVASPLGRIRKLSSSKSSSGYLRFNVSHGSIKRPIYVHQLHAYQIFGEVALDLDVQVRHLDGDRQNNSRTNLALGSQSENMMDRQPEVRQQHAAHAASFLRSLTTEQVLAIRCDSTNGMGYKRLSAKYNIPKSTIRDVVRRKVYKDLGG